jgi:ABC-type multidrug transport system fused ATPase/permease subunit
VAVFVVQGIAGALRYAVFTRAGERIVSRLRTQLFSHLLEQDIAFFDREKTGDLLNRLSSDTTMIQNTVSVNISQGLRSIVAVLGGVGLLFWTSVKLTFVMLLVVPPVALLAVHYGRRVRNLSKASQQALADATDVAQESLSSIRTVRAFTAERKEAKRFAEAVARSLDLAFSRTRFAAMFFGVSSIAAYVAGALVFWFGGRLVMQRELTPGALTSFLVYTLIVAFSLSSIADLWADVNRSVGASDRVFELLGQTATMKEDAGTILDEVKGEVRLQDVVFSYPSRADVTVLRGLNLHLPPGKTVALVGTSGSGKSTIASLIYRLYDPSSGVVTLDGVDVRTLKPAFLRKQVGVVSQEPLLFSTTVIENIRYGRVEATDEDVFAAAVLANADGFIRSFPEGYQTRVGERGVQLSGGQKQRIAIARALLKDPRVLILDEATSALDAESEHVVQEAIVRLMKGRTTLLIAHRLSTIRESNSIVVMQHGEPSEQGTHAELMARGGAYKKLVERQLESLV